MPAEAGPMSRTERIAGWSLALTTLLYPVEATYFWLQRASVPSAGLPGAPGIGLDLSGLGFHCGLFGWLGVHAFVISLFWMLGMGALLLSARLRGTAPISKPSQNAFRAVLSASLFCITAFLAEAL